MSFKSQIEVITGVIPATLPTDDLQVVLANGCKDIIRRVELTNSKDMWLFTKTQDVLSSGLSVDSGMIYDVERGSKPCKDIAPNLRYRAAETDSIHFATGEFPVYYLLDQKIFVLPQPGIATPHSINTYETYNSGTQTQVNTATSNLFVEGDYIQIAQLDDTQDKTYVGYYRVSALIDSNSFIIDRDYTDVSASMGTYTSTKPAATATSLNIPSSVIETSDNIDYFPANYYPFVILYGAMAVLMKLMADLNDNLPTVTIPVAPSAPVLKINEEDLPSITMPSAFILPTSIDDVNLDFSAVPDRPTYSNIPPPQLSTLTYSVSDITITNLDVGLEPPIAPPSASFSSGALDYETLVRSKVPSYTKPTMVIPAYPTIQKLTLPEAPVAPADISYSTGNANISGIDTPSYVVPVMNVPQWTLVDNYIITEEDIELAQAQLQKIQAQIAAFQADVSDKTQKFTEEMSIYTKEIDVTLKNTEQTITKENLEYQANLSRFQADVQRYQTLTNNLTTQWAKENIEDKFAKWNQEYTYSLQKYGSDAQNELNKFNMEMAEYQQEVSKAQQDSTNLMTSQNNEYTALMSKYTAELQTYQAATAHKVTEWQAQVVQKAITEFTQLRSDELQKFTQEEQLKLTKYSAETQSEQQRFQQELAGWNGEITKEIQRLTTENSADTSTYTAKVQAEAQRWSADIQKAMELSKSKLEIFSSNQTKIGEENQGNMSKYTQEVASWTAGTQSILSEFQALVDKDKTKYEWLANKLQALRAQYDSGFLTKPTEGEA